MERKNNLVSRLLTYLGVAGLIALIYFFVSIKTDLASVQRHDVALTATDGRINKLESKSEKIEECIVNLKEGQKRIEEKLDRLLTRRERQ